MAKRQVRTPSLQKSTKWEVQSCYRSSLSYSSPFGSRMLFPKSSKMLLSYTFIREKAIDTHVITTEEFLYLPQLAKYWPESC